MFSNQGFSELWTLKRAHLQMALSGLFPDNLREVGNMHVLHAGPYLLS